MNRTLLAYECIAVGVIWLIVTHRAQPHIMLGLVAGFLVLCLFQRKEG